ncbi:MAG: hypothetical protein LBB66_10905 [Desulfovibrio sp.]|nr:hypothetical protein [Desulfovibrio sp.]
MKLGQFLVDDEGELSCMRLMCLLVDVSVLGVWIWGNIKAGQYVPLGYAEAGLLGAAHGGKALQGRFEYGGRIDKLSD